MTFLLLWLGPSLPSLSTRIYVDEYFLGFSDFIYAYIYHPCKLLFVINELRTSAYTYSWWSPLLHHPHLIPCMYMFHRISPKRPMHCSSISSPKSRPDPVYYSIYIYLNIRGAGPLAATVLQILPSDVSRSRMLSPSSIKYKRIQLRSSQCVKLILPSNRYLRRDRLTN